MIKVGSAQFKAKLGAYLRAVRAGDEVVLTDRDEPIAKVVPFHKQPTETCSALPRDPSSPPLGKIRVRPVRYAGKSTTALLREDRDRR